MQRHAFTELIAITVKIPSDYQRSLELTADYWKLLKRQRALNFDTKLLSLLWRNM